MAKRSVPSRASSSADAALILLPEPAPERARQCRPWSRQRATAPALSCTRSSPRAARVISRRRAIRARDGLRFLHRTQARCRRTDCLRPAPGAGIGPVSGQEVPGRGIEDRLCRIEKHLGLPSTDSEPVSELDRVERVEQVRTRRRDRTDYYPSSEQEAETDTAIATQLSRYRNRSRGWVAS